LKYNYISKNIIIFQTISFYWKRIDKKIYIYKIYIVNYLHWNIMNYTVHFKNVTVKLSGVEILKQVSAFVPKQGSTAVVGPNGAGKTTLLLALLGQIPFDGSIDTNPESKSLKIGYVPQRLHFDRGLPMTVLEFLLMDFQRFPLWMGTRKIYKERAMASLESVHAENLYQRPIGVLSGGELQRVLLALALQQKPDLLVLDEPAAGVDIHGEHIFCELLEKLRAKHCFTQLMVSHDLATVTHHATHVICLNRTVIAQGPPQEVLTNDNLSALFGLHRGLINIEAMPMDELPHIGCATCTCLEKNKITETSPLREHNE